MESITLATLPNATAQQVFDFVVAHLRKQGRKSQIVYRHSSGGSCQYRMAAEDDGTCLRCAAGCLMADSEYVAGREGNSWAYLSGVYGSSAPPELKVPRSHAFLIKQLQDVHDNLSVEGWEDGLKKVASVNNLEYVPVEK